MVQDKCNKYLFIVGHDYLRGFNIRVGSGCTRGTNTPYNYVV